MKKILNRTSVRSYKDIKIDSEIIENMKKIINSSPTSMNESGFSAIFITDKNQKERIRNYTKPVCDQVAISEAPLLIIFCADYNRIDYACKKNGYTSTANSLDNLISCCGDAFIASSLLMSYCIDINLSTCYIGVIRAISTLLKKELNLTNNIIPVVGMVVGFANNINEIKPKLNRCYNNKYSIKMVKKEIDNYDLNTSEYYQKRVNGKKQTTWSKQIGKYFSNKDVFNYADSNFLMWSKKLNYPDEKYKKKYWNYLNSKLKK